MKIMNLCALFMCCILFVTSRDISTSDRISQIVESRMKRSGSKRAMAIVSPGSGEKQPLSKKPRNVVTKTIDSYAQQRAKAMKLRADHRSEKKGLRRIG